MCLFSLQPSAEGPPVGAWTCSRFLPVKRFCSPQLSTFLNKDAFESDMNLHSTENEPGCPQGFIGFHRYVSSSPGRDEQNNNRYKACMQVLEPVGSSKLLDLLQPSGADRPPKAAAWLLQAKAAAHLFSPSVWPDQTP